MCKPNCRPCVSTPGGPRSSTRPSWRPCGRRWTSQQHEAIVAAMRATVEQKAQAVEHAAVELRSAHTHVDGVAKRCDARVRAMQEASDVQHVALAQATSELHAAQRHARTAQQQTDELTHAMRQMRQDHDDERTRIADAHATRLAEMEAHVRDTPPVTQCIHFMLPKRRFWKTEQKVGRVFSRHLAMV